MRISNSLKLGGRSTRRVQLHPGEVWGDLWHGTIEGHVRLKLRYRNGNSHHGENRIVFLELDMNEVRRLHAAMGKELALEDEASAEEQAELDLEEREADFESSQDPDSYRGPDGVLGEVFRG